MTIEPDAGNGLEVFSVAQRRYIRTIAVERLAAPVGNVGPEALTQIREVLADLLDLSRDTIAPARHVLRPRNPRA